jgi:glycosyltransferase involved in cell wall biosynthesis
VPLVSVVLAAHNDARFLPEAVDSVLRQTLADFELVVIDDASTDETQSALAAVADSRLRIVRNEQQLGLAASLNRGLDESGGRFVARLDADDVALPERLQRQLDALRASGAAVVGSAVRDLDEDGRPGRLHRMPVSPRAVRWHALFSSPFFHPTAFVEREALGELRYDTSYLESEDYDLWTRLLATGAEACNVEEALVLKRVHAGQASIRRGDVQESFQRRVALREIGRLAPHVDADGAWRAGARKPGGSRKELLRLLVAFERAHGRDWSVRTAVAKALL